MNCSARPDQEVQPSHGAVAAALAVPFSAATLHEAAGKVGALASFIKPVARGMLACGRAFPVETPGGDNLWLHRAVYVAGPGDGLVVFNGEAWEAGYWGGILNEAATARGHAGVVIDGGVRGTAEIWNGRLPVFSRTPCIRGTAKLGAGGSMGLSVRISGARIERGDLVVGDDDGVVVIPAERVACTLLAPEKREIEEQEFLARIMAGEHTLELLGLSGHWGPHPMRRNRCASLDSGRSTPITINSTRAR
jgi:4-hydroxy-4-methyl-2-oxoglutarate aldolase